MRYTHYFDVLIANEFQSDFEDFDKAFAHWSQNFPDDLALRARLLASDESLKTICQGIVYSETFDSEEV